MRSNLPSPSLANFCSKCLASVARRKSRKKTRTKMALRTLRRPAERLLETFLDVNVATAYWLASTSCGRTASTSYAKLPFTSGKPLSTTRHGQVSHLLLGFNPLIIASVRDILATLMSQLISLMSSKSEDQSEVSPLPKVDLVLTETDRCSNSHRVVPQIWRTHTG